MKKAEDCICTLDHSPFKLKSIEGVVYFSEQEITSGNFENLTLKFVNNPEVFWIKGNHFIKVGDKVRGYYAANSTPATVFEAYELLDGEDVIYRYRNKNCEFGSQESDLE